MVKGSTLETSWMLKMCTQWKGENWYGNSRIGLRYNTGWLRQNCMEVVGTEVLSGGRSGISQITLPSGMPLNTSMKMACRCMVLLSHPTDVLCFLQLHLGLIQLPLSSITNESNLSRYTVSPSLSLKPLPREDHDLIAVKNTVLSQHH